MEYATTNRAAIIAAIKKGIIVVEAAGNGGNNLDQSDYQGRFDRDSATYPDSGAIVVGAGHAPGNADPNKVARSRMSESNYGDRVDLQGWGESVVTTGYGDLFDGGANRRYTDVFSGTSAASAMAAGAAASLQGAWLAANASPLSPACVRKMLVETGSPQVNDPLSMFAANIGPLPDLEAALKLSAQEVAYLCGFEINFHKPDLYWLPLIRIIIPDHWVELLVWLANGGPAPIKRGYMVEFYVDNELVHRQAGPRLEPGDRAEMAFRYERIREGQSVRIVADAQRELDELDEANNEFLLVLEGACE